MSSYILERLGIISFLFITITCNVNSGHSNSKKIPMSDTLKIEGCQEKIKVEVGSIVEIKLEAIPATGYQWLLKDSSQLLQLLDAESLNFTKPETEQPIVGLPVLQILHFKAMKKGEEVIRLEYKRTWEKEIGNSCEMKIEVN